MSDRLPDFLGLGTQKGGTTSLHQWLNSHPEVFLPACKEVHYFDLQHKKEVNWYSNHFNQAKQGQKCGEITPFYLFHPEVPARIHSIIPSVRMIVMLRDPVERTISQIYHARKRGFETLLPEDALAAEQSRMKSGDNVSLQKHSYVSRSRYLEQLDRYETFFPQKQLLILKSEDMFADPIRTWKQLTEFLEIKTTNISIRFPQANAGDREDINKETTIRKELRKELKATALGVRERYGFGWDWG